MIDVWEIKVAFWEIWQSVIFIADLITVWTPASHTGLTTFTGNEGSEHTCLT